MYVKLPYLILVIITGRPIAHTLLFFLRRKFIHIISRLRMALWLHVITIVTVLLFNAVTSSSYKPVEVPHHLGPGSTVPDIPVGNETVSLNKTWSPDIGSVISCGAQYRTNLKVRSCQDAVKQIPDDARSLKIGYNKSGRKADVPLPFRFISCEL